MPEFKGDVTWTRNHPYHIVADTEEEAIALARAAFDNNEPTQGGDGYCSETIDVQVKRLDDAA